MKYFKFLIMLCLVGMFYSCGSDDDICESGEGTPRMKIAFRSVDSNKEKTVDSLSVAVDYGSGKVDLGWQTKIDSRLIPLRVDDSPYTDIYFKTSTKSKVSQVRVKYTTQATYVSPGCGAKKTYDNVSGELITSDPIQKVENGQNQILNEDKTNLYLVL
ncbi:hypothetical protein H5J24_00805 [Chryseobacterium capnotolerans]|uniref:DUF6452 family protein n=2 Tax=Chryseobacterium TaxID=59732 RepID=UPI00083A2B37|nr:DUF6452 family protein [Chryseobacterium timonianum]UHO38774.1 hypothetical protein H5J24_00805 [Chryseobacterium capnotolerans]